MSLEPAHGIHHKVASTGAPKSAGVVISPSRTFDTKQQAQQWTQRVEGDMDSGLYFDRSESERTTLREALERYQRDIVPEKRHRHRENRRIQRWIDHDFSYRTLVSLRGADVAKYRDERRSAGLTENTIRAAINEGRATQTVIRIAESS